VSTDFGASISEEPSGPVLHTANIRKDQFGRTAIDLSENHASSSSNSSERSSGSSSPAANGVSNGIDADRSHSVYSNNSEELNQQLDETLESRRKEDQFQESNKEVEKKTLDHAVQVSIAEGSYRKVLNKYSKERAKPTSFSFVHEDLQILNIQGLIGNCLLLLFD